MKPLVATLAALFPQLTFTPGKSFYWSPKSREIYYQPNTPKPEHLWALLHETGHALLDHRNYQTDIALIKLEVAAWQRARELAWRLDISIDEDHIEDCLDTYRDWLHARSICPTCTTKALQQNNIRYYRCFNCHTVWQVTPSRFCRAYRSTKGITDAVSISHSAEIL